MAARVGFELIQDSLISSCCDVVRSDGVRSRESDKNIASKPRREEAASVAHITTVRHSATERSQTGVLLRSHAADSARCHEIQVTALCLVHTADCLVLSCRRRRCELIIWVNIERYCLVLVRLSKRRILHLRLVGTNYTALRAASAQHCRRQLLCRNAMIC